MARKIIIIIIIISSSSSSSSSSSKLVDLDSITYRYVLMLNTNYSGDLMHPCLFANVKLWLDAVA